MPRKPRIFTDSGTYHIISRGNNRQDLFLSSKDCFAYLDLLRALKKEYRFDVYHYCLMTNHVHLLVRFYDHLSFQKVIQRVNVAYAKRYCKLYNYIGHVFQDRYKSLPIERDSYLLECGRYIERNPLTARLVKQLTDYPWSSYSYYADGLPNDLITDNPLYLDLGFTPAERRVRYQDYVLTERIDTLTVPALFGEPVKENRYGEPVP